MLIGYILIISLVLLDQLVKLISYLVIGPSFDAKPITIIKHVFNFHYIENTGASFGMLEGYQWFFSIITIFSLLLFGYFFTQIDFKKKKVFSISVVLFIAGTFGNAIDRLFRDGAVIDMIEMPILNTFLNVFKINDFIFNVADIYLNFAIILFVIDILFLEKKRADSIEENLD